MKFFERTDFQKGMEEATLGALVVWRALIQSPDFTVSYSQQLGWNLPGPRFALMITSANPGAAMKAHHFLKMTFAPLFINLIADTKGELTIDPPITSPDPFLRRVLYP